MTKKIFAIFLFGLVALTPLYAQKFTKREKARREARENYYFCGNMFTFTAGYNHSWFTPSALKLTSSTFGKSEKMTNTQEGFNLGFLWDHGFKDSKKWSLQSGLYYTLKGGDHLFYYDNGLGAGPQLKEEETKELSVQGIEAQALLRRAFAINKYQRITVNVGPYITKILDKPDGFKEWDLGAMVGVGYDYKHLSASVSYQPGCFPKVVKKCNTRQANISVNIGYRIWKK